MGFRFEKLYADLVTPDGTVCVVYLAWLHAWGLRRGFAGLEVYWPDGRREVVHAAAHPQATSSGAGDLDLSFDVPGGPFVLTYRAVHGSWAPDGAPPCDGLRWSVKVPRAEATGRWAGDPGRPVLRGVGYADCVEIARPTRTLNLGLLRWGRVHLPDATLVYTAVDFRSGPAWQRAAHWADGAMAQWDRFAIGETESGTTVKLDGRTGQLLITPHRALHVGDAIDRARFPGALERMFSSAVTGRATERRSLGRAHWTAGGEALSAWGLHETVRFGPPVGVAS